MFKHYLEVKKGSLTYLLVLVFSIGSFSQDQHAIDSLQAFLSQKIADTARVNTLHQLFLEYEFIDRSKAKSSLTQAMELAKETEYQVGIIKSYNYLGYLEDDVGNYPEAMDYFLQALRIARNTGNKKLTAFTIGNMGSVYTRQGNYLKALEFHLEALISLVIWK